MKNHMMKRSIIPALIFTLACTCWQQTLALKVDVGKKSTPHTQSTHSAEPFSHFNAQALLNVLLALPGASILLTSLQSYLQGVEEDLSLMNATRKTMPVIEQIIKKSKYGSTHDIKLYHYNPEGDHYSIATSIGKDTILIEPSLMQLEQSIKEKLITQAIAHEQAELESHKVTEFILNHELKHLENKDVLFQGLFAGSVFPGVKLAMYVYKKMCNRFFAILDGRYNVLENKKVRFLKNGNERISESSLIAFVLSILCAQKYACYQEARADRQAIAEMGKDGAQGCLYLTEHLIETQGSRFFWSDPLHPSLESRRDAAQLYLTQH